MLKEKEFRERFKDNNWCIEYSSRGPAGWVVKCRNGAHHTIVPRGWPQKVKSLCPKTPH